jgi:hypothetical protein
MDTVTILRGLWRRRLLVVVVILLALLAGAALMFGSKKYSVGLASARILVNTPHSQIVDIAPRGGAALGQQALLLASLMVDGDLKSVIAHKAGLKPSQIVGVGQSVTAQAPGSAAPSSTPTGPNSYVLTTQVLTDSTGNELPIIELDAQAPSFVAAETLATATIAGVHDYLSSVASVQGIPEPDRLQVTSLGAPQATTQAHGPSTILAVLAVVFVFCLGCSLILGIPALARGWRAASIREQMEQDGLLMPEPEPERRPLVTRAEEPFEDDWAPALTGFDLAAPAIGRSSVDSDRTSAGDGPAGPVPAAAVFQSVSDAAAPVHSAPAPAPYSDRPPVTHLQQRLKELNKDARGRGSGRRWVGRSLGGGTGSDVPDHGRPG